MTVVSMTVNGKSYTRDIEPRTLLVHFLRDTLGLTGTKIGCDTVQCGACTVHLDGEAVKSCCVLAVQANGAQVTTIEGVAQNGHLSPMQDAFWEKHGLQCGYCTPGMIMTSTYLLKENPHPSEAEIRHGLEGNLCRCTGYHNIVRAVRYAAGDTGADIVQDGDTKGDFEFVGHDTDYKEVTGNQAEAGAADQVKEGNHG